MKMNNFLFWLFFVFFTAFPVAIMIFLCCKRKDLDKSEYTGRFGSLYEGLNLDDKLALLYPV